MRFKLNPAGVSDVTARARPAVAEIAKEAAVRVESLARVVDPDYSTEVELTATGARITGRGGGINPAGWIEFGTGPPGPTPAYAPMRRGIQAAGLHLKASK